MAGETANAKFSHWRELIGGLVLSAALFFGAQYLSKQEAAEAARPDYIIALQDEIRRLRSELVEAQSQIVTLSILNADIAREVGADPKELQIKGLIAYVDALNRPAWCKRVEREDGGKIVFRMEYINVAYELAYGVSQQKYIGQTDFDNHNKEAATAYYSNDLLTYRNKGYREYIEPVSQNEPDANVYQRRFAKFYVKLPSGPELICGIQVNGLKNDPLNDNSPAT